MDNYISKAQHVNISNKNIVFVGAVGTSLIALEKLIELDQPPVLVVTLDPQYSKRHSDYEDIGAVAKKHGVPVLLVNNINEQEVLDELRRYNLGILLVIGWSQLLKKDLMALPEHGSIGYHPALLPKNRGRAVIPWTILQQATKTAGSLLWLAEGVDDGDLIYQRIFQIDPITINAETLMDVHFVELEKMIMQFVSDIKEGALPRMPQDHTQASWCAKRTADDGQIDWRQPAKTIGCLIRAVGKPYPGAFAFYKGQRVRFWQVEFIPHAPYYATVGQIVELDETSMLIAAENGFIRITEYESDQPINFNLHGKFDVKL